jgi:4,5-dihydroxyphthalate decarboxylase
VRALQDGTVTADGIELNVLTDMDPGTRHSRMLKHREFDVAEISMSSYLMAADRNQPFAAIPVFLHRRFRHGFIFINTTKGIEKPSDLIGGRIGVHSLQATAILWMRGILEEEYGVPHGEVNWVSGKAEEIPFTPPDGMSLEMAPPGRSLGDMLAEGELDAVLHPDVIEPILEGDARVGRLFEDYQAEELAYFQRTGIFPIMHVTAIRPEIVEQHPWVVFNLMRAFDRAKQKAYQRRENPRVVALAWFRNYLDQERAILGEDPWEYGLTDGNRTTLEAMIRYSHRAGLISRELPVDELFLTPPEDMDTGRGEHKRH